MKAIFAFVTVLLVYSVGQAQETPCDNVGSEVERKDCLQKAIGHADKELNRVYKLVIEKIQSSGEMATNARKKWENSLRQAQRDWLKFKDGDCEAVAYEVWPGSAMGSTTQTCLLEKITSRTKELQDRSQVQ